MPRAPLPFVFNFAWRDLCDPRSRGTMAVMILTIAAVTALTLLALGLPRAAERARRQRLQDEPLTLCLWTWDADGLAGRPFTSERLLDLERRLQTHFSETQAHARCYPIQEMRLDWRKNSSGGPVELIELRGRTLAPGDPMLNGFTPRNGTRFMSDDQAGVVVTSRLLEILGYPANLSAGTVLQVRSPTSHERIDVSVVGVLDGTLPFQHCFVFTEAFARRLWAAETYQPESTVYSGPVPEQWPDPHELPPHVKQALREFGISPPRIVERTGQPSCWKLTTQRDVLPTRSMWRIYAGRINELMKEAGKPLGPDFERLEFLTQLAPPTPPIYELAAVYVDDLAVLEPAATVLRTAGLQTNDSVILQLRAYGEATEAAQRFLLAIAVVVFVLAAVNLMALQALRLQKKVSEIGMLRAVGMNEMVLLGIHVLEASLLGFAGTLIGITFALVVAELLTYAFGLQGWISLLTPEFYSRVGMFLVASFLLGWMSSAVVTVWIVHASSPAESLNKQ